MRLLKSEMEAVKLESLRPFVASPSEFFDRREHYRLLAYLSTKVRGRSIIDIGTHNGDSALALSVGGSAVHSFDIVDKIGRRKSRPNVSFYRLDLFDPTSRDAWRTELLSSGLILIDVDPHEGSRELE